MTKNEKEAFVHALKLNQSDYQYHSMRASNGQPEAKPEAEYARMAVNTLCRLAMAMQIPTTEIDQILEEARADGVACYKRIYG